MERLTNFLGLKPWEAGRLQVSEIVGLVDGEQERWNRVCELVAWAVVMFTSVVPKLTKGRDWRSDFQTMKQFLDQNTPPGYRPKE